MPSLLRDKIAQLILVRFGSNISPRVEAADDFQRVAELVQQHKIGGVILFNGGTAADVQDLLNRLQAVSTVPLLVTADMERGLAQQTIDLEAWPHALAFDALADEAAGAVEEFARLSAIEARSLGVHLSFSPVADIHRNPDNPIIANRAFGTTAARVAELATAYVRGCHAGGLLCCGKHFPGHGNTREDSHAVLPVVGEPLEEFSQTDLKPFRDLAASGTDLIMSAHVAYLALDPTGCPATLSRAILTDKLRHEWGYEGAIITDSMKMVGVRQQVATERAVAVAAVRAGVDLLLDVSDVAEVIDTLEQAAQADPEFAARVDDAYQRAQRLKQRAVAVSTPDVVSAAAGAHALSVARQALTIVGNDGRLALPIAPTDRMGFLLLNPLGDNAYTKTNRIVELFRSRSQTEVWVLGPTAQESQAEKVHASMVSCDACLVALVVSPSAWQQAGIPAWQRQLVQQLSRSRPTIVASMGIPDVLRDYPAAAIRVVAFSDVPASQTALFERITG